jgi:hypothetical protein
MRGRLECQTRYFYDVRAGQGLEFQDPFLLCLGVHPYCHAKLTPVGVFSCSVPEPIGLKTQLRRWSHATQSRMHVLQSRSM